MKLTAILLLKWNGEGDPNILGQACDLSSFGFFQRGAVKEMISFVGRTVAKRTQRGQRQTVQQVRPPPLTRPYPLTTFSHLLLAPACLTSTPTVERHAASRLMPCNSQAQQMSNTKGGVCAESTLCVTAAGRVLLSCAQPRRAGRHRLRGQGVPGPISFLRRQQGGLAPFCSSSACGVADTLGQEWCHLRIS